MNVPARGGVKTRGERIGGRDDGRRLARRRRSTGDAVVEALELDAVPVHGRRLARAG